MPVIRKRSSWSTVPSRSFLHWSAPQLSFPAGDIWSVVIVYKVRFQKRMPLRSCAATEEATSPNAIKASNTARILASRKLMHRLPSVAVQKTPSFFQRGRKADFFTKNTPDQKISTVLPFRSSQTKLRHHDAN